MSRLLYEQSTSYHGHLIIPFLYQTLAGKEIFSYRLLSEWGYKGRLHRAENPGGIYSCSASGITQIAREYLDVKAQQDINASKSSGTIVTPDSNTLALPSRDYFRDRYTYRENLIIVFHARHKFFYDHYPPTSLKNIAAPKIFNTERACLTWIKNGIDTALAPSNVLNS
ncbi:MAG: hypothetical protein AAGD25_21510 [Cyanobacteria bacterium P01_F01_bin.150]